MSITDFFHDSPVLATILTVAYVILIGIFIYMLIRMYRR